MGRPSKQTEEARKIAHALRDQGLSINRIALAMELAHGTIERLLGKVEISPSPRHRPSSGKSEVGMRQEWPAGISFSESERNLPPRSKIALRGERP
jgi:hypothetical protein